MISLLLVRLCQLFSLLVNKSWYAKSWIACPNEILLSISVRRRFSHLIKVFHLRCIEIDSTSGPLCFVSLLTTSIPAKIKSVGLMIETKELTSVYLIIGYPLFIETSLAWWWQHGHLYRLRGNASRWCLYLLLFLCMKTTVSRAIAIAERKTPFLATSVKFVWYNLSLLPNATSYIEGRLFKAAWVIRSLRCLAVHTRSSYLSLGDVVMDLHLNIAVWAFLLVK